MANITTRLGYGERTEGPAKEHLAAARPISDSEYDLTVKAGFVQTLVESEFQRPRRSANNDGLEEEAEEFERPIVEMVVAQPFREAAFAVSVKDGVRKYVCDDWTPDYQWRRTG